MRFTEMELKRNKKKPQQEEEEVKQEAEIPEPCDPPARNSWRTGSSATQKVRNRLSYTFLENQIFFNVKLLKHKYFCALVEFANVIIEAYKLLVTSD